MPAPKQAMPGPMATRSWTFQCQGTVCISTAAPVLDSRATRPTAFSKILGKIDLWQPAGKPQPAVVGDDANFAPPGLKEGLNAFEQQRNLIINPRRELPLQRMAQLIELPVLGPGTTGRVSRLVHTDVLVVGSSQELTKPLQW